uniref:Uncharacterized protein n=1 Tax=Kalanchoe fedtschenkoi TaxID=63787 RepID=A0A7N0TE80_KALFE
SIGSSREKVFFDSITQKLECSYKLFLRVGYMCRHGFLIWKCEGVDRIPSYYVLNRWSKHVTYDTSTGCSGRALIVDTCIDSSENIVSQLWIEFRRCLSIAGSDYFKLSELLETIKGAIAGFTKDSSTSVASKFSVIGSLIGSSRPTKVLIYTPEPAF